MLRQRNTTGRIATVEAVQAAGPPLPACAPPAAASYDGAGNMTGWGSLAFTYDALNQMASRTVPGINSSFAYSADGERVFVRDGTTFTLTLRDLSGHVLREMTTTGGVWSWKKDYVYRDGSLLASVDRDDGLRHYHLDHLGSPRMATNRCGERFRLYTTMPFGTEFALPQDDERMRFTVHERDLGSLESSSDDMDYMHAKSYPPILARLTGIDPVRGSAGKPQSWNLYAYVSNNPINLLDPDGLAAESASSDVSCGDQPCAQAARQTSIWRALQAVALHWWNDSRARMQYIQGKQGLSKDRVGDPDLRSKLKPATRRVTSPSGADLAEVMRPMSGEAARQGGNPAKGNATVDLLFASRGVRLVAPLVTIACLANSAYSIASAPEGQGWRTAAGESGSWVGSTAFGEAAAQVGVFYGARAGGVQGAALFGAFGLVYGGMAGGETGQEAGFVLYDLFSEGQE